MINKLIVDGLNITLSESTILPFTYTFSTAGIHNVRIGLDDTEEICAYAFKDCADLIKVTFPSKITMIKRNAFENCESLKSINIPSTIKYVGPNVFDGCNLLSEINFEDTTPPTFLTNLDDSTTCYIPDGCKFILAEELIKDGSVQYYKKNELGGYDEVDYEALEDGNEYYYDGWLGVHTHSNVVEQRFKNRPTEIGFYDGDVKATEMRIEQGSTNVKLFEHRFTPEDTSNTNVFFISSNPNLVSVDQTGHINVAKNVAGRSTIYVCSEPYYNGTYVSAALNIRVLNDTGTQKIDPPISISANSAEITNPDDIILPTLENTENLTIVWSSSNENVATVGSNGEINIVKNGTTTIKAIFNGNDKYNAKELSYELTINIPIEKRDPILSFSNNSLTITNANNYSLPTLTNEDNVTLVWSSSDEEVATVNQSGEITIIANGTTTIKARFNGNDELNSKEISYTLTISIEIEKQDPQISFGKNSINVKFIKEFNEPEIINNNNLELVWSSSDEEVATVNQSGEITIIANGTTTISATFAGNEEYNSKTISYELIIQLAPLFYVGITKPNENNIETLNVDEYSSTWTSENPYTLDFSQMNNGNYWMMLPKDENIVIFDTNNNFEMGYSKDSTITYFDDEYDIYEIELGTSIYSIYQVS